MSDWAIILSVAGAVVLLAALIHGVERYRRLAAHAKAQGEKIPTLSLAVWRQARKIVVLLLGGSVIAVGVLLIVLPGPAFVVIPIGIGILAIEFAWARRWLRRIRLTLHVSAKRSRRFLSARRRVADESINS